jgi:hypothetical protein
MRALSIQQPWASLIINGYKRVENRSWPTRLRGWFLIHAGKTVDKEAMRDVHLGIHPVTGARFSFAGMDFPTGGIIGKARLIRCVDESDDPFFVGPFGFVLDDVMPLPFQPCRGMLGFFNPGAGWSPPDYLDGRGPMTDMDRLQDDVRRAG